MQTLRMSHPLVQKHLPMYTLSGSNNISNILQNILHYERLSHKFHTTSIAIISPCNINVNTKSVPNTYNVKATENNPVIIPAWLIICIDGSIIFVPHTYSTSNKLTGGYIPWYELMQREHIVHIGEVRKTAVPNALAAWNIPINNTKINIEEKYSFTLAFRIQIPDNNNNYPLSPLKSKQISESPVRNTVDKGLINALPSNSIVNSKLNEGFEINPKDSVSTISSPYSTPIKKQLSQSDENINGLSPTFNPFLRTPTMNNSGVLNSVNNTTIEITEDKSNTNSSVSDRTNIDTNSVRAYEIILPLVLRRSILNIFRNK